MERATTIGRERAEMSENRRYEGLSVGRSEKEQEEPRSKRKGRRATITYAVKYAPLGAFPTHKEIKGG